MKDKWLGEIWKRHNVVELDRISVAQEFGGVCLSIQLVCEMAPFLHFLFYAASSVGFWASHLCK